MHRFTLLILCTFLLSSLVAQTTYIHAGHLMDGRSKSMAQKQTIIVQDNRIIDVQNGFLEPNDTIELIDLSSKYVLPGLMDMHVHIESQSGPKTYENRFRMNDADVALQATAYCERTLMAGFTTVRDLGGSGVNVSLRNAIKNGLIVGPRIYTCEKALASTGGHADPTNGVRKDLKGDPGPKQGVVNGLEDARKAVRQRYKNGADCIKVTATGGVLSVAKDGLGPQFEEETLREIVKTSKDYGYVTAAHAHGVVGMQRAIRAGINSIEHGTLMDEETMKLMKEHGTYLVPTISAGRFVYEKAKNFPQYFPAVIRPKALSIGKQISETAGNAYRNGVKIAFGTDSGVSPHGDNAKEFEYMVEAGIPAEDAILSSTKTAAELMRIEHELGAIKTGYLADIIAVEHNPIEDITTLQNVIFVMKDGKVHKKK